VLVRTVSSSSPCSSHWLGPGRAALSGHRRRVVRALGRRACSPPRTGAATRRGRAARGSTGAGGCRFQPLAGGHTGGPGSEARGHGETFRRGPRRVRPDRDGPRARRCCRPRGTGAPRTPGRRCRERQSSVGIAAILGALRHPGSQAKLSRSPAFASARAGPGAGRAGVSRSAYCLDVANLSTESGRRRLAEAASRLREGWPSLSDTLEREMVFAEVAFFSASWPRDVRDGLPSEADRLRAAAAESRTADRSWWKTVR